MVWVTNALFFVLSKNLESSLESMSKTFSFFFVRVFAFVTFVLVCNYLYILECFLHGSEE